jgi:alkylhydroperoxidase family enzyme
MDINAAVGSEQGLTAYQLDALTADGPIRRDLFDDRQLVALEYADAMTASDVDDALFERVRGHFDDDEIVELTALIAWENSSARFNRALRVPSQGLWKR